MLEQSPIMTELPMEKSKSDILPTIFHPCQMTTKAFSNNDITKDNSLTPLKEKTPPLIQPFFSQNGHKCYSTPDKKLHKKVTIKEPFVQKVILVESYKEANYMMTYDDYSEDNKNNDNKNISHCPCKHCIII